VNHTLRRSCAFGSANDGKAPVRMRTCCQNLSISQSSLKHNIPRSCAVKVREAYITTVRYDDQLKDTLCLALQWWPRGVWMFSIKATPQARSGNTFQMPEGCYSSVLQVSLLNNRNPWRPLPCAGRRNLLSSAYRIAQQ